MPVIRPAGAPVRKAEPEDGDPLGPYQSLRLGDACGLTQFGANLETLAPGSRSSDAHWHEAEDEFVYVLEGVVTLHEGETSTDVAAGEAMTFRANDPVGHQLENRTEAPVRYLMIGTRSRNDVVHYTQIDKIARIVDGVRHATDRAGRPLDED
ncbi:MAG: cupin domain-containing protein [Pseudomonadota bacterium]